MKHLVTVARVLLGLGFCVFGANILFPFLPQPPFPPESPAMQYMMVMGPSHFMAVVGVCQLLGGALVLFGGTAPLGLIILAPILVNIVLFHVLLMGGEGVVPGIVFSALEIFLIYAYRAHFKPLLSTTAKPVL